VPGVVSFSRYDRSWLPGDMGDGLAVAAIALTAGIACSDFWNVYVPQFQQQTHP
jgi:MFS superfamily sulfate permease-like transporter